MKSSRYDCPFNSIADHEELFKGKKDFNVLENITHIMDCECFYINEKWYYREVSVVDIGNCCYESIQCFNENLPSYFQLDEINRRQINYQQRFHGLKYLNYKENTTMYSQLEMLNFLRLLFSEKNVLVGYKGGNIESKLCKILNISAVNLEHFGIEKYDELVNIFNVNVKRCQYHYVNIIKRYPNAHCSLYEVILFAARICDKLNNLIKKRQFLIIYGG